MKPSDILNRAAAIIIERGHCKNALDDDDGRVCLLGALIATKGNWCDASSYVRQAVSTEWISEWNNRDETTEAMVIGALHAAALLAKADGR